VKIGTIRYVADLNNIWSDDLLLNIAHGVVLRISGGKGGSLKISSGGDEAVIEFEGV